MTVITVRDAKCHCNITGKGDDVLIAKKIAAAEAWVAQFIGKPLNDPEAFPNGTPEPLKEAVRQLVAYWYEQREAVLIGVMSEAVPFGVYDLLTPYRDWVF